MSAGESRRPRHLVAPVLAQMHHIFSAFHMPFPQLFGVWALYSPPVGNQICVTRSC